MPLIYMTVFGEYEAMARQAIATLRHPKLGNYSGRIMVFTDDPLLTFPNVEMRPFELPKGKDQFYWSCRARVECGLLLDHCAHDWTMYVDADVLFAQDIAPLFSIPEKLYCHEEATFLWGCQFANAYLTAEEIADAQIENARTINAGMFVIPGAMAKGLFERWRAMLEADPHKQCVSHNPSPDQSAFNAIIRRGELPSQVMPYEWVVQPFGSIDYPLTKCLHFAGQRRKRDMHRRYMALLTKAQIEVI